MNNDRFKYRVWYKLCNKYVEKENSLCLMYDAVLFEYDSIAIESDNYIIEQCTGLKDKNGNLIYESDIVKDMTGETYQVIWHNNFVGFIGKHLYQENRLLFLSNNPVEITGNIHETE